MLSILESPIKAWKIQALGLTLNAQKKSVKIVQNQSSEKVSESSDSKKVPESLAKIQKLNKIEQDSNSESISDVSTDGDMSSSENGSEDSDSKKLKTNTDIQKKKKKIEESSSYESSSDVSSTSGDLDTKKLKTSKDVPKKKMVESTSSESSSDDTSDDTSSSSSVSEGSDSEKKSKTSTDIPMKKKVVEGSSSSGSKKIKPSVTVKRSSKIWHDSSSESSSEDSDSKKAPKSVSHVQKSNKSDSSSSESSSVDTSDQTSSSETDSENFGSKEKSKPVVEVQKSKTTVQDSSLKSDLEGKDKNKGFKCNVKIPISRLKLDSVCHSKIEDGTCEKPKSIVETKNLEKEEKSVRTESYKTSKSTEKSMKMTSGTKNYSHSIVDLFVPDIKIKVVKEKKVAGSSAKNLHSGNQILTSHKIPVLCIKKLDLQNYTALGYGAYFVGTDEALAARLYDLEKKEAERKTKMRVDYYEFDWPDSSDSDDHRKSNKIKSKGGKSGHSSGKSDKKKTKRLIITSDPEDEVKQESAKPVVHTQKKPESADGSALERPKSGSKTSKIIEDGFKSTEALQITEDHPKSTSLPELDATKGADGKSSVSKCSLKEPNTTEDWPKFTKGKSSLPESEATKGADGKSKCSLKEPNTTDQPKSTNEKFSHPKKSLSLTKKLKTSIKTLKKLSVDKGLKLIKKKTTTDSLLLHSDSSKDSSHSSSGLKIKSAKFVDTSDSDTTEVKGEPQKESTEPKRLTPDSTEKPKLDKASDLKTTDSEVKDPKEKTNLLSKPKSVKKSDELKSKLAEGASSLHGKQLATTKIKSKELIESSDTSDSDVEMVPKSTTGSSAKEPSKPPKGERHRSANESKYLECKSKTKVEHTSAAERPKSVENEAHLIQKSSDMKPQLDVMPSSSVEDSKVTCEKRIHSTSTEDKMRVNIESSADKPKSAHKKVEISHFTLPSTESSKPKEKLYTTSKSSSISRTTEEKIKTDDNTSKPSVVPRLIEVKTNNCTPCSSADKIEPKSTDKSHTKPKSTDDKSHTKTKSNDGKSQMKPKSTNDKSQMKPKSTDEKSHTKPKSTDDKSQTKSKSTDDKYHTKPKSNDDESQTKPGLGLNSSHDKPNRSTEEVNFSKKKTKRLVITSDSEDEMKQESAKSLDCVEVIKKRPTSTDERSSASSAPKITENELKSTETLKVTEDLQLTGEKSRDRSETAGEKLHRRGSRDERPQEKSKSSEKHKLTAPSALPKTVVGKSRDRSNSTDSKSDKSKSLDIPKSTEKPKSTCDSKSVEKNRRNSVDETKTKSKPSQDKLQHKPSNDSTEDKKIHYKLSKSSDGQEKTMSDKSEDKQKSSHVRAKSIDSKSSNKTPKTTSEFSDQLQVCNDSTCDPTTLSSENKTKVQQSQLNKDTIMLSTGSANPSLPKLKHDKENRVSKPKIHTSKKYTSSENKHIPASNMQNEKQSSSEKSKFNENKFSKKITDLKVSNKLSTTSESENKYQSDNSVVKSTESKGNSNDVKSNSNKLQKTTETLEGGSKNTAASENKEPESERKPSSDIELLSSCKVQLMSVDITEKDAKTTVESTLKHKLDKSECDKENALSSRKLKSTDGQQKSAKETPASLEELTEKSLHSQDVKVESAILSLQNDVKSSSENLKFFGKTKECFVVLPKLKSDWESKIETSRPLSVEPSKSLKLFVSECLERPNSVAGVIDTEVEISKTVLDFEKKSTTANGEPVIAKSKPADNDSSKSDVRKEPKISGDQKEQSKKLTSSDTTKESKLPGEVQKKQAHERSSSQGKAPKPIKSRTLSLDRKPKDASELGEKRSLGLQGDGPHSNGKHRRPEKSTEKGSKPQKERSKSLSERPTCMKSSKSGKERRDSTDKQVKTSEDKSISQSKHKHSTGEKSECKKSELTSKSIEEHSHKSDAHKESTGTKRHHDSVDENEPLLKKPKILEPKKNEKSEEPESGEPKPKKLKLDLSAKKSNLSINKISSKSSPIPVIPTNKTLRIVLQDIKNIWTQPKPGVFRIGKITFTEYKENKYFNENGMFGKKSQKYIASTFKIPLKKSHSSDQNKSLSKETCKSSPLVAAANKIKERSLLNIQKTKFKPDIKEVEAKKFVTKFKKLQSNVDRSNISVTTSSPLDVLKEIGGSKPKVVVVAGNDAATQSSSAGFSLDNLLTQMSANFPVKQDRELKKCTIVKEHPVDWAKNFIHWKFLSSDLYKQRVTKNDFDLHTPVAYQLKDYMENSYNVEVRDVIEQDRHRHNKRYKTSSKSKHEQDSSDDEDDCYNNCEILYSDWLSCKFYDANVPEPTDVPDFDSIPVITPALVKHVVIEKPAVVLPTNPSTPSTSNDDTSPNDDQVNYYDDYEIDNQGNYLDDQQNAEEWEEETGTEQSVSEDTDIRQESVTFTRSPSPFPAARNPSPPPPSVPTLSFLQRAGSTKLNY
ncbi:hypothetical protein B566_EDAN009968 [Ephemera danica]|nr:hypothetical protein B566_EDAN009968 [Ephemera danica]